jgi:hypothetical protein
MAFAGWTSACILVGTADRTSRQLGKRGRIGICPTTWTSRDVHNPLKRLEDILPASCGTYSRYNGHNSEPSKERKIHVSFGASVFEDSTLLNRLLTQSSSSSSSSSSKKVSKKHSLLSILCYLMSRS